MRDIDAPGRAHHLPPRERLRAHARRRYQERFPGLLLGDARYEVLCERAKATQPLAKSHDHARRDIRRLLDGARGAVLVVYDSEYEAIVTFLPREHQLDRGETAIASALRRATEKEEKLS